MRSTSGVFSLILFATLACDASLGSIALPETGGETEESSSGDGDGDGDGDGITEPFACIAGSLCPEGRSCSNGLCVIECSSDDDCGEDDYCGKDGLCHGKTLSTCNSDQECAVTQSCLNQVCTANNGEGCNLENYLQDGCPSNAVCLEDWDGEQGTCHEMPICAEDGSCPVGLEGAVCSGDYLPTKDPLCLIGSCETVEHCPNLWSCVRYNNEVLGWCSSGGFGDPCTIGEHCISGNCVPLPGLGGGLCE